MRTKTLLLTAAAMAAGLLSTYAQVYSANVVGYYNTTVPAKSFYFAANQLQGTNGDNTINDAFANGFFSDGNGVTNSVLYWWNGTTYKVFTYYSAADSGGAAGWYDALGNLSTVSVNQGGGAFIYNAAGVPLTYTVVGQVLQGTNNVAVPQGFTPFSITPPISTNIDSSIVSFPSTSPGDGSGNTYDTYYQFTGVTFRTLNYYNSADASPLPAGWYDALGNLQSTNPGWWPVVGQAFFIYHTNPHVTNWVSSFTVQ